MKTMKYILFLALTTACLAGCSQSGTKEPIVIDETGQTETIVQTIEIDSAWAGHPVEFCLLTHGERQYIAYYNANRNMVVGLGIDKEGSIHLSGNMHVNPLNYFRSNKTNDISTLEQVMQMVGTEEDRCTYPKFMNDRNGELIFHYRDGGSGNGNEIYNIYNTETKTWNRLLDTPLTDGQGLMNA